MNFQGLFFMCVNAGCWKVNRRTTICHRSCTEDFCHIFLLGWLLCHYYNSCFQWLRIIPVLNVLNRMKMSLKCRNLFHRHLQFQRSRREFWLISIIIPLGIWKRNLGKKWEIHCVAELLYGVYLKYLYQLQEWVFYIKTNKDTHINIMLTKHTLCHKNFLKTKIYLKN